MLKYEGRVKFSHKEYLSHLQTFSDAVPPA